MNYQGKTTAQISASKRTQEAAAILFVALIIGYFIAQNIQQWIFK